MAVDKRFAAIGAILGIVVVSAARVGERDNAEARAIAVIRAITSGEQWYASLNGGYYDTVECLANPGCVPGDTRSVRFIAPNVKTMTRVGDYIVQFHRGPAAEAPPDRRISRSAMTRFAVVATPANPDARRRSFCADDRLTIFVIRPSSSKPVEDGRCLETAIPLR